MSVGPASKYRLIIPKASYINSFVRQGIISREAKKGFSGWIILTSMAMRDSPVVTLELLLRHFIDGRIVLIQMTLPPWSLNQVGHIGYKNLRRVLKCTG